MRSSGLLRNMQLWFLTDVEGQPIGPIFKVYSRNVGNELPKLAV